MIDPDDAVMLLVDHQSGLFQLVRDMEQPVLRSNVTALAKLSYLAKIPTFTTASVPDGPNGPSLAYLLQDRSYEIDPNNMLSSVPGRQRGWSKQKDQYVIAEVGISFNIGTYKCPTAN